MFKKFWSWFTGVSYESKDTPEIVQKKALVNAETEGKKYEDQHRLRVRQELNRQANRTKKPVTIPAHIRSGQVASRASDSSSSGPDLLTTAIVYSALTPSNDTPSRSSSYDSGSSSDYSSSSYDSGSSSSFD